jgi:lactoylglutathione lyase
MSRLFFTAVLLTAIFLEPNAALAQIDIKGVNHLSFSVENLEVSTRFYQDVLGLKQLEVPENLRHRYVWFHLAPGQELHLLAGRQKPVNNVDPNGMHIALTVPDADVVEKYMIDKKIPYKRYSRFDGAKQIYINDPDGYMIEFTQPKI